MPTKNIRKKTDSTGMYYLIGGFIVGCLVGRVSSSVPLPSLPEIPNKKDALETYENAVHALKALVGRLS
jgi:hypothetical protein